MTDAAIIYRSHVEAIENLPEEQQLSALKAIIHYCMDDEEPDGGMESCVLAMAKPVLDKWKSNKRAGKKGGEANRKHVESKPEATEKQPESKCEPKVKVKDKVKDKKENNKKKDPFGEYENVMLTDEEFVKLVSEFGEQETNKAIDFLDAYIAEKGYKSRSHYLAIRRWVLDAITKQKPPNKGTKFQNFPVNEENRGLSAQIIEMCSR